MRSRVPVVVAAVLASCAMIARAQAPATLNGKVRQARDSAPISGAMVELVGRARAYTDSMGAFTFGAMRPGRLELRVRRLGFEPFAQYVDIRANQTNSYDVAMTPLPVELKEVMIEGKLVSVPHRFEDVYRRAASGFGHLITLEEIERRRPFYVRELLNGIPGIFVDNYKVRFRRCGDANNWRNPDRAKVQVYIDGQRVTRFDADETNVDAALSLVSVTNIQAIEVYSGIAQIPGEFLSDACAVIAIWTKRH